MKYKKIALLAAAALTMTQMLGISAAAEEDASSAEDSVVDADSLGSDESSEESFTSGDYTYFLDGENAKITKYNNSDETNVVVPDELDGHKVVSLGSGTFATKDKIVSVTLPAALTEINSSCFYGCTSLEKVELAEGNTAFTVTDGVLFSADGEDLIVYPDAMEGTSYTIPDGVKEIWTSAFSNTKLTDVTFPDGVLYIDD